jgi:hypothetical protein
MRSDELLQRPELRDLATEHALLLRRQLEGGPCAVEDALIVQVEALLSRAARACDDVAGIDLAYDALSSSPVMRLRDGRRVSIPINPPALGRSHSTPDAQAEFLPQVG